MNRTLVLVGIVVLLLAAYGAYRVTSSGSTATPYSSTAPTVGNVEPAPTAATTPSTNSASMSATMVTVTNEGFTPQTVTIKAGDTVTWTNNAPEVRDVSSAMHPTHLVYPPLNLGNIAPGESKSLTFPTAGTYKYHDHINAKLFGTVVVQ